MSWDGPLGTVFMVLATIAAAALIWAAVETARTMRSWRLTSDELRTKGSPVLEKAEVAVDAASAELLRIDAAITRFEEASVRVSAASGTLTELVQAPAEIVTGVAGRVRRAWKERKRSTDVTEEASVAEPTDASPSPAAAESHITKDELSPGHTDSPVSIEDVDRTS